LVTHTVNLYYLGVLNALHVWHRKTFGYNHVAEVAITLVNMMSVRAFTIFTDSFFFQSFINAATSSSGNRCFRRLIQSPVILIS
jgi:hypothetical protein